MPVVPAVLLLCGGAGYLLGDFDFSGIIPAVEAASNCDIKGNVSIETGERIYHVPGQPDYSRTRISPEYDERWFCTEDEARRAGWRRARN